MKGARVVAPFEAEDSTAVAGDRCEGEAAPGPGGHTASPETALEWEVWEGGVLLPTGASS